MPVIITPVILANRSDVYALDFSGQVMQEHLDVRDNGLVRLKKFSMSMVIPPPGDTKSFCMSMIKSTQRGSSKCKSSCPVSNSSFFFIIITRQDLPILITDWVTRGRSGVPAQ